MTIKEYLQEVGIICLMLTPMLLGIIFGYFYCKEQREMREWKESLKSASCFLPTG